MAGGFCQPAVAEGAPQPNSEAWEPSEGHALLLLLATPRELSRGEPEQGVEGQDWRTISGLILSPVENGRWERIGSFTEMVLNMEQQSQVINGVKDVQLV